MSGISVNRILEPETVKSQTMAELVCQTAARGLVEITREIGTWIRDEGISNGMLTCFIRHTSASLVIQENADPSVQTDLLAAFAAFAPDSHDRYVHNSEGPDDMPAHIRAALTQTAQQIPVASGKLQLGTWQGLYLFEHRLRPHHRRINLHFIGN